MSLAETDLQLATLCYLIHASNLPLLTPNYFCFISEFFKLNSNFVNKRMTVFYDESFLNEHLNVNILIGVISVTQLKTKRGN